MTRVASGQLSTGKPICSRSPRCPFCRDRPGSYGPIKITTGHVTQSFLGGSNTSPLKTTALEATCVHVLHETLNVVISRRSFAEDDKEMYQSFINTRAEPVF